MYKTKRRVIYFIINAAVLLLSVIVSILIVLKGSDSRSIFVYFGIPAVIFLSFLVAGSSIRRHADNFLRVKNLESGYTSYINKFIDALRFCYSFDDFYKQISEILELQADCAVLFIDREKNYVLYNSPDRISSYYTTRDVLSNNFPAGWKDGFYYLGNKYGIVSSYRQARGFFICYQGKQFFVFNRYTMLFDTEIYSKLTEEFFAQVFADFQPEETYNESQIMSILLDFIAQHYAEPLTLDTLAEQVNEKAAHVSYLFYKYKNIRPIDYLINYRVRVTTELLRSGDYTVTQAAHEVGYRDACYFSRIYKKRMGFPPTRILP